MKVKNYVFMLDIDRLREVVENFKEQTLFGIQPKNMCFITSYVLSKYLNSKDFTAKIIKIEFDNSLKHFVVKVLNTFPIIIDVTIDQFENAKEKLFVGVENDYKSELSNLLYKNTILRIQEIEECNNEDERCVELWNKYSIKSFIGNSESNALRGIDDGFDINDEAKKNVTFLRRVRGNFGIVVDTNSWETNFNPF